MTRRTLALLSLAPLQGFLLWVVVPCFLLLWGLGSDVARAEEESSDPPDAVKTLKAIQKAWKAGKVDAIIARLPSKGTIGLALSGSGMKAGKYRKEQATALLKKYFAGIKTKEFKPTGPSSELTQFFKHTLIRLATDETEKRRTLISLAKEGDAWVIVEIKED